MSAPTAPETIPFVVKVTAVAIVVGAAAGVAKPGAGPSLAIVIGVAAGVVKPGAGPSLARAFIAVAYHNNTVVEVTTDAAHVNKIKVLRANVEDPSQARLLLSNTTSSRSFECRQMEDGSGCA